jgi:hypothetical protein
MDDGNNQGGYSLADLADLDVSNIEEVRFVNLPAGIFGWEVKESELKEYEKDGITKYKAEVELELIEVKSVIEPNVDKESLVGKRHTERLVIDPTAEPEDVQKAIGRIRAFVADTGMSNVGKLGDIVANLKGHQFVGKIIKQKDRDDKTVEYARLRLDPAKR